jgi:hypothetical protein
VAHMLDRCDVLDALEESVKLKRAVRVEAKGGLRFVDHVREVIQVDDKEWAIFRDHDRLPVDDISFCARAEPLEPTYRGKRGAG